MVDLLQRLSNVSDITPELHRTRTRGAFPTLQRAVVLEVFFDLNALTSEYKNDLKRRVTNPFLVDSMPINSILARIVSGGQDLADGTPAIFYPLFQSHLMLPIEAGEQVFVIFEDQQGQDNQLGRWLTRIHESDWVEDVNFTHGDRRFDNTTDFSRTTERLEQSRQAPTDNNTETFPNGRNTSDTYTLQQNNNINSFDTIYSGSEASKAHTYEPVPRYSKRPDELVLQGMNNSLIMLGPDRIGPATRLNNSQEKKDQSGTIDLVCGRGRYPVPPESTSVPENKPTSTLTVRNSRGKIETDKRPQKRNKQKNQKEGQQDFKNDAARIYVSMHTNADKNFGLLPNDQITYPQNTLSPEAEPATNTNYGKSFIVEKADNIRIIARKVTTPENINGTILLIKEGTNDLGYIFIDKLGKIQVEGSKIYLGSATQENEPYIKFSEYNKAITKLQENINELKSALTEITGRLQLAFASSNAVPYAPIASLNAVGPDIVTRANTASIRVEANNSDIRQAALKTNQSTKIFGS